MTTHNVESEAREKAVKALVAYLNNEPDETELSLEEVPACVGACDAAINAYLASLLGDDVVAYIQRRQEITVAFIASQEISYEDAFRVAHSDRATLLSRDAAHTARIATLEAERDRLREALKPFAEAADIKLVGRWEDHEPIRHTDVGWYINFGHLRRARATLNTGGGE